LVRKYRGNSTLVILNKTDLPRMISRTEAESLASDSPVVEISALKGTNLAALETAIKNRFSGEVKWEGEVILQLRHKILLERIRDRLLEGRRLLDIGHPEEIAAEEVKKTLPVFSEFTGEIQAEDVLRDIFSRFCVGK